MQDELLAMVRRRRGTEIGSAFTATRPLRFQDFAVACACASPAGPGARRTTSLRRPWWTPSSISGQLREPAAFPGWLRRDRPQALRPHGAEASGPPLASLDRESRSLVAPGAAAGDRGPRAQARRRRASALGPRGRSPSPERMLLALQYLGGQDPARAIASHARAPPHHRSRSGSTPRAVDLRERLAMLQKADLETLRPSRDDRFCATVELFLAVRAGDRGCRPRRARSTARAGRRRGALGARRDPARRAARALSGDTSDPSCRAR